jgi:hypothetical protein
MPKVFGSPLIPFSGRTRRPTGASRAVGSARES